MKEKIIPHKKYNSFIDIRNTIEKEVESQKKFLKNLIRYSYALEDMEIGLDKRDELQTVIEIERKELKKLEKQLQSLN